MDNYYNAIEAISARLNLERYNQGIGVTLKRGKVKQFSPCPRAVALLAMRRANVPLDKAIAAAAFIPCECHPYITENTLTNYGLFTG